MVDKEDVYLNIKLKYKNKIEKIKSKDFLTIDEIKSKIKELFSMKKCNFEDLELFCAKNNEKIVKDEDLIFLPDEISEYEYAIEIDVKKKLDEKIKEIDKLKNEIKELVEKKKNLICQNSKMKILIEHNKKKMKIKKDIHIQKKHKYLKDLVIILSKEIFESINFGNIYNNQLQQINEVDEKKEKSDIDTLINNKKKLVDEELNKISSQIMGTLTNQFQQNIQN